jgi:hypothetical protein
VKILFVARHFTYFRNFDSVLRLLASRGHRIHLAVERDETEGLGGIALVERLAADYPGVTFGEAPSREPDQWAQLSSKIRLAFDYVRYLEPQYDGTPRLRSRSGDRAPTFVIRFGETAWARRRLARAAVRYALRKADASLPPSQQIDAFLRQQRPDVMIITPLVGVVGSPQPDYVRAARALRIPTALAVWSWDHLSSKALIRDVPDRVFVWNDVQRGEAKQFHGVSRHRVVVTGAQCFDHWFERVPSRSRAEFCAEMGVPADRSLIMYVGSALFRGSPPEVDFAMRWIDRVRTSADPRLRSASILIRPHPQRLDEWRTVDVTTLPDVAVRSANPVTEHARADYFDALFYSAAVVGLNTSAFLEAGIVGRPVLAILPSEYHDNQEGTLHFRYLTDVSGGLVRVSRSLEEHEAQLRAVIAEEPDTTASRRFVETFLRPYGLDVAATPRFADAVEALQGLRVPGSGRVPSLPGRGVLKAMVVISESRAHRAWMWGPEERRRDEWRVRKGEIRSRNRRAGLTPEQQADAEREMRGHRANP